MDVTKTDGIVFVYNLAVVFTGANITTFMGFTDRTVVLGISTFLALVWTVYFRWSMLDRLAVASRGRDE